MSASDQDPALAPASQIRLVIGVMLAGFCCFLQLYATQPLLALLMHTFNTSEAAVSLTVSAPTLALALASPFIGMFADSIGRKRVIVPCIFGASVATLLCAAAPTLNWLIFWRFLCGVFTPGIIAVTIAYITEESPRGKGGAVMGMYITSNAAGGLTGRLAAGFIAGYAAWQWAFVVLGVITLAGALGVWWLLPRSQKHRNTDGDWHEGLRAMGRHFKNGPLLATFAAGFNVLFCHVGLFTYITFRLSKPPFSLSVKAQSMIFLVYGLGVIISPITGKFVDRYGHRAVAMAGVAALISGALLTLPDNLLIVIIGVTIASSGVFITQAAASSHIGKVAKEWRSAASGIYVSLYYGGGSLGATGLALPWHLFGWYGITGSLIVVQLASAVLAWRYFARGPHIKAEPALPIE